MIAVSALLVATFRIGVLLPPFGEQTAHQPGTILYLLVQFFIIYFFIKKLKLKETKILLGIGIFWVVITIIFKFIFGHYVVGHLWQQLFADYNLFKERLWIFFLINNIAAPLFSSKIIKQYTLLVEGIAAYH